MERTKPQKMAITNLPTREQASALWSQLVGELGAEDRHKTALHIIKDSALINHTADLTETALAPITQENLNRIRGLALCVLEAVEDLEGDELPTMTPENKDRAKIVALGLAELSEVAA